MYIQEYASPLGTMTLAAEEQALAGIWFAGQKYYPDLSGAVPGQTPVLALAADWLDRYFAGQRPEAEELPLCPRGTVFQRQVWEILKRIPYGETVSYAAIARQLACRRGVERMSAQAVGGAVSRNPVSVVIPCHRVVAVNGSLTGYAGGLERKQWLLEWEASGR